MRAPKMCGRVGCVNLVRGQTYCDEHRCERGRERSASAKRTGTRKWTQGTRRVVLKRDPGLECRSYPAVGG